MTEQEAHNSVQIKFKNHVSYSMIKNLNARFGRIFTSHGVQIRQKHMKCAYDLFIRRFLMQRDQYKCKQLAR